MGAGEEKNEAKAKEKDEEDEDGAFDVSNMKGRLGKRPTAGGKRSKKGAGEDSDKKKAEAKKPKQKVGMMICIHTTLPVARQQAAGSVQWRFLEICGQLRTVVRASYSPQRRVMGGLL